MDYFVNLAAWATAVVAFLTLVSAGSRLLAARFQGRAIREVMEFNPPAALAMIFGRVLPLLLRGLAVLIIIAAVAILLTVLT